MMVGRDSESVKITFRRRQRSRRLGHMLVIGVWLDHQEATKMNRGLTSQVVYKNTVGDVVGKFILHLETLLADDLAKNIIVSGVRPNHWLKPMSVLA
jgi:hypothetical protein